MNSDQIWNLWLFDDEDAESCPQQRKRQHSRGSDNGCHLQHNTDRGSKEWHWQVGDDWLCGDGDDYRHGGYLQPENSERLGHSELLQVGDSGCSDTRFPRCDDIDTRLQSSQLSRCRVPLPDLSDASESGTGTAGSGWTSITDSTWTTPTLSLADSPESGSQQQQSSLPDQLQWSNEIPDGEAAHSHFFPHDISFGSTPDNHLNACRRNHDPGLHLSPTVSRNLRQWLNISAYMTSTPTSVFEYTEIESQSQLASKSTTPTTQTVRANSSLTTSPLSPSPPTRPAKPAHQKQYFFVDNKDKKTASRLRNTITSRRARQSKIEKIRELEAKLRLLID